MKSVKKVVVLLGLCGTLGFAENMQSIAKNEVANIWAGVGYYYASHGGSAGGGLAISLVSVGHAALEGAVWGSVFPGCGTAVGIGVGL